jgi:hypothetical protein
MFRQKFPDYFAFQLIRDGIASTAPLESKVDWMNTGENE